MAVRLAKPWQPLAEATALGGHLGVFELADEAGRVLFVGYAGGYSLTGLRGVVRDAAGRVAGARTFRVEVNSAYRSRYLELLMAHVADHGGLPPANAPEPGLGRLSPA
jgi:hypothetical protein